MLEILLAIKGILSVAEALSGLAATLQRENRSPTPEEAEAVKAAQRAAEADWRALLPKD